MKTNQPRKRVAIVSLELVKEASTFYVARTCTSPQAVYELFAPFIETKDREHFVVAGLNVKNEPTAIQVVHIGTINQSLAFPRDILKRALLSNSVSICVGHNHPSGSVTASLADIEFTTKVEITLGDIVIGMDKEVNTYICMVYLTNRRRYQRNTDKKYHGGMNLNHLIRRRQIKSCLEEKNDKKVLWLVYVILIILMVFLNPLISLLLVIAGAIRLVVKK